MTAKRIYFVGLRGAGKTSLLREVAKSFSCVLVEENPSQDEQNSLKSILLELNEPTGDKSREEWKERLSLARGAIVFVIDGSSKTGWRRAQILLSDLMDAIGQKTPLAVVIHKIDLVKPDFSEIFGIFGFQDLLEALQASVRIFHTSIGAHDGNTQFMDWIGEQICLFPRLAADEPLQVLVFLSSGVPIAYIGPIKEGEPVWQDALLTAAYAALDLFSSYLGDGGRIKTLTLTSPDLDPRLLRVAGVACEPIRVALITRGIAPEQALRFGEAVAYYFHEHSAPKEEGHTVRYSVHRFFQVFSNSIGSGCPCNAYMPDSC
ncbi:MAG: GTPase domain-containing protein [Candidatus Hodarchaeales archaeon]